MTIIRRDHPRERIHVCCNNLRLCLWSDGLTIHQLVQEKQKSEIPRDGSGVNVQSSQVKSSQSLLAFRQRAMDAFEPNEGPKEMSS